MAMTMGGVNSSLSTLNRIQNSIQKTTQKISTGSNYPGASYGASEYAISQRMYSNIRATSQSIQNTQNVSSMVKTAAGATENTINALSTIKENLINAANGTNSSSDRAALQGVVNQMVQQINDNANVEYNGMKLLDGSRSSITVAGVNGYENVSLGDMRSQALGLTDAQGNSTLDLSTDEGIQAALETVGGALNFVQETNGNLQASLDGGLSLDAALDEATTQGAYLQRLEYQEANYTTQEENELAAVSNMSDADIAKQITELKNQQTQEQLALFATKMFNQNRANILNLLQ